MTGSDWLLVGGFFVWSLYVWLVVLPLLQQTRADRRAWREAERRRELNRIVGRR